jgi:hypothetical protein
MVDQFSLIQSNSPSHKLYHLAFQIFSHSTANLWPRKISGRIKQASAYPCQGWHCRKIGKNKKQAL